MSKGEFMAKKIPSIALQKGPDLFYPGSRTQMTHRGVGSQTFIYTKYADPKGKRIFVAPASVSHVSLIEKNPDILKALFGPKLDNVMPEITEKINGKVTLDGYAIRSKTIDDNVYGRTGYYQGHKVVMFWYVKNWAMALEALDQLDVSDDDIITVGTSEVGSVASVKKKHFKKQSKVIVDKKADDKQKALELIKYHTATGIEKEALRKKLFSNDSGVQYPDVSKMSPEEIQEYPWKRQHWRQKAKEEGLPDPFDYGESTDHDKKKGFSQWMKKRLKKDS